MCKHPSPSEYVKQRRDALASLSGLAVTAAARADALRNSQGEINADDLATVKQLTGVIKGFFPTPTPTGERMVTKAKIPHNTTVSICEPNAGAGHIADVIMRRVTHKTLTTIETSSTLCDILRRKGYNPIQEDFLTYDQMHDFFIMNPPFENDQDIQHVQHAHSLTNPYGRVVSIMSEGTFYRHRGLAPKFREWLYDMGGVSEKLPEGTFKLSGTNVSTRLVIIDKWSKQQ